MMPNTLIVLIAAIATVACNPENNSAATDKASRDVREAQTAVAAQRNDLSSSADEVERRKRAILAEQQQLADKEAALVVKGQRLGSAQDTAAGAAVTYRAAVTERLAKLDAALATLATKADAASKDESAGMKARRDRLASQLDAMPASADATWPAYTKEIDATFDAIEHDLRAAK